MVSCTIEKTLFDFKVADLKSLCKELRVKVTAATKTELVGRLLSRWQIGMFSEEDSSVTAPLTLTPAVQQQLSALPPFKSVKNLVKDVSSKGLHIHGLAHVLDRKQRQRVRS